MDSLLLAADPDQVEGERRKAKELKKTSWWKNRLGEGVCHYCRQRFHPSELTMDHCMPLVRGGKSTRSNCVPACKACNRAKQNHPGVAWKAEMMA